MKDRRFRLVPTRQPRQAQTPSRSWPQFPRAAQSRPRAALSTNASLLPIGAVGLVPLLHDGMPPTCISMTTTPRAFSKSATPSSRCPVCSRLRAVVPLLADPTGLPGRHCPNSGSAPKVASGIAIAAAHGLRRSPVLTRGGGHPRAPGTCSVVSTLEPAHRR